MSPAPLRLPAKKAREWLDLLERNDIAAVETELRRLLAASKPRRSVKAARARKAEKDARRHAKTAEVRRQVVARASDAMGFPVCEVPDCATPAAEMDHFWAGAERRPMESMEGCWMLCRTCHRTKHEPSPILTRRYWLEAFLEHSEARDLKGEPQRKAQAELDSLELKQSLPHGRTAGGGQ